MDLQVQTLRSCFLLLFFSGYGLHVNSQDRRCGLEELYKTEIIKHPERVQAVMRFQEELKSIPNVSFRMQESDMDSIVLTIPVVVHIIHNDKSFKPSFKGSTNISDQQVYSQIRVLNEDYGRILNTNGYSTNPVSANIQVEFCLASIDPLGEQTNGINRIYHPKEKWGIEDEDDLKALSYWPSDQYLNIWVCNLNVAQGLGYARYPYGSNLGGLNPYDVGAELDGIVIQYRTFGTVGSATYPYNLGRTATHEIGHWLGLIHIWGDAMCGNDFVVDTPTDQAPNQDKDCADSSYCTEEWVHDLTNNYMDFSPDACMNMFTKGQKQRIMMALLNSPRRKALFSSKGCKGAQKDELNVKVYPNPSSDYIHIELYGQGRELAKIELYNYLGEFLEQYWIECDYQKVFSFPLDRIPSGIYFFNVTNDSGKKTVKLVVSH